MVASKSRRRRMGVFIALPFLLSTQLLAGMSAPAGIAAPAPPSGGGFEDAGTPGTAERPDLILDAGPVEGNMLSPGSTATWNLGVTTRAVTLSELTLLLRAEGALASASEPTDPAAATVQVQSCDTFWINGICPGGGVTVIPRTPLGGLYGEAGRADLVEAGIRPGEVSKGSRLLVSVHLPSAAPNSVQGFTADLVARVDAAGEAWVTGAGVPDDMAGSTGGRGDLAQTGFRLGGFLLLGLGAVAAGLLAASWGKPANSHNLTAKDHTHAPGGGGG